MGLASGKSGLNIPRGTQISGVAGGSREEVGRNGFGGLICQARTGCLGPKFVDRKSSVAILIYSGNQLFTGFVFS